VVRSSKDGEKKKKGKKNVKEQAIGSEPLIMK